MKKKDRVLERRHAGPNHNVLEIAGSGGHQRRPCAQCPWRTDLPAGEFPAEAFRISARTAYDAAIEQFACHMTGMTSTTCAGFLLANSVHNLGARLAAAMGRLDHSAIESPYPLYGSYREMAIANGVDPDDPVLEPCRADQG